MENFNFMIKAVFFDIDGTLVPFGTGKIPDSIYAVLIKLKEKGIKIFLATGRDYHEIKALNIPPIFDGQIMINGQMCMSEDGTYYYKNAIHPTDIAYLKALFDKKEVPILLVEEVDTYINFIDDYVKQVHKDIGLISPPIGMYSDKEIYQSVIYADEKLEQKLKEDLPHCQVSRWHESGVDVFPKDGGKEFGIIHTLEYLGLSKEECMAFGDGDNDATMLAFAGIGVAMGNGSQIAKEAADYVTTDIEDHGIEHALKHFGII
jgi:hypothetical protein